VRKPVAWPDQTTGVSPGLLAPRDCRSSSISVPAGGGCERRKAGPGPAVLFAHAGIAGRRMRDDQVAALPCDPLRPARLRLAQPPGRPHPLDAVPDYASVSQAAPGGCSLPGAIIIIEYALAHPARVTSLVPDAARHPRRHRKMIEPGPEDETT